MADVVKTNNSEQTLDNSQPKDGTGSSLKSIQILIKFSSNTTKYLTVRESDSIKIVKSAIKQLIGIPEDQQRLYIGSQQLNDDNKTILDYNVHDQDVISIKKGGIKNFSDEKVSNSANNLAEESLVMVNMQDQSGIYLEDNSDEEDEVGNYGDNHNGFVKIKGENTRRGERPTRTEKNESDRSQQIWNRIKAQCGILFDCQKLCKYKPLFFWAIVGVMAILSVIILNHNNQTLEPKPGSLKDLCAQTEWHTPSTQAYINCTRIDGGVFNALNGIMTCTRWAIDAGMGLVIPKIRARLPEEQTHYSATGTDFNYLFDLDHFKLVLQKECPQLILLDADSDRDFEIKVTGAIRVEGVEYSHGTYRSHVYDLMKASNKSLVTRQSTLVLEDCPNFCWRFGAEEEVDIRLTLLNAIQFNERLKTLGLTISNMIKGSYIGIHLRAEADAGWQDYDSQVNNLIEVYQSKYSYIRTIYLAVGDQSIADRFRISMNKYKIQIITKWSLTVTNKNIWNELKSLTFDQNGAVDYEPLMKSEAFFGIGGSSFTYAIAAIRGNGNLSDCKCHILGGFDRHFLLDF